MPRLSAVTYEDRSTAGAPYPSRREQTFTEFDEWCNLTKQTTPDGTVTEWSYFPADGAEGPDGAPPEPNGFVRLVRRQTVTPPGHLPTAPIQATDYAYAALPTVAASRVQMPATAAVLVGQGMWSANRLLTRKTTSYQTDPASSELGRITRIEEHRYPGDGSDEAYAYTQDFIFAAHADQLMQTVTTTTHDGLMVTTARSQSRWSGRVAATSDAQGNTARYGYDAVGRILSTARRPGTGGAPGAKVRGCRGLARGCHASLRRQGAGAVQDDL